MAGFPRFYTGHRPSLRLTGITIDVGPEVPGRNLAAVARVWALLLGVSVVDPDENGNGRYAVLGPGPGGLRLEVQLVEHPSRVHLDFTTTAEVRTEVEWLLAAGIATGFEDHPGGWTVVQTVTGHRLCILPAPAVVSEQGAVVRVPPP
jgi:hypothetical protein